MFREYFILLLLAHVVSDFYIQTEKMARKKDDSINWVILHCLSYWLTTMGVSLPVMSWEVFKFGSMAAITHLIIDVIKYEYVLKLKKKAEITAFKDRNIF